MASSSSITSSLHSASPQLSLPISKSFSTSIVASRRAIASPSVGGFGDWSRTDADRVIAAAGSTGGGEVLLGVGDGSAG
jgi:hypothetical protein